MKIRATLLSRPHPLRSQQMGVSLIELMISVAIGLVIMAGVLQLFADMIRSSNDLENSNAQIENGRFALQVVENDLAHAGFWGGYIPEFDDLTATGAPGDIPADVPEPCKAFALWDDDDRAELLGIPVEVYEDVPAGCEAVITSKQANTDILIVRHAGSCVTGSAGCGGYIPGIVYFQPQFCGITNDTAYESVLSNDVADFVMQNRACLAASEMRRYVSNIYYVRNDNVLMRVEFGGNGGSAWGAAQPIVEGVEGFAVELGIDNVSDSGAITDYSAEIAWADPNNKNSPTNRGDGTPDGAFIRCTTAAPCLAPILTNVVAAKLYVLVRNPSASRDYTDTKAYALGETDLGPFNDNFKRHVYSTTARLINISSRRQTP